MTSEAPGQIGTNNGLERNETEKPTELSELAKRVSKAFAETGNIVDRVKFIEDRKAEVEAAGGIVTERFFNIFIGVLDALTSEGMTYKSTSDTKKTNPGQLFDVLEVLVKSQEVDQLKLVKEMLKRDFDYPAKTIYASEIDEVILKLALR